MKLFGPSFVMAVLWVHCAPAAAADPVPRARPEVFDRLLACRSVSDASARLACYDEKVAAIDAAAGKDELVVVDRTQIRKARRSLFGLTLPNLGIFGDGGQDKREGEGFTEIESTISRAYYRDYRWNVILDDGARWVQIDGKTLVRDPKAGQKIRIRKAALSSFLANIDGQTAIKMRREN
jgi:hypothetical protein